MSENVETVKELGSLKDTAPIAFSCLGEMRERRADIVFFTPALLVTHGRLPVDPAVEFASRVSAAADKQPFCVELPFSKAPFFSGLGSSVIAGKQIDWDRRLYGIVTERAKECFDFLGGIGISDGAVFASSVSYQIDVPDPTARLITATTAKIPVNIFGVLRDNTITYLAPNGYDPPYVSIEPTSNYPDTFKANQLTAAELKTIFW
jgi:hypothetical protein